MVRSDKIKFALTQAAYWASIAVFGAFAIALARDKGISVTFVGIMAAVFRIAAVVGQFFWGALCDKLGSNKKIFILTIILTAVFSLAFYFVNSAVLMLITYALMGFVQAPTGTNLDTWLLKKLGKSGAHGYGPIRSMGSLGYAVVVFVFGLVVAGTGYGLMPISLIIFTVLSLVIAYAIKDDDNIAPSHLAKFSREDVTALFKNKGYIFLLTMLFFNGFATMSIGQMKVLIWEDMGASIAFQGYDGFFIALAQVPVFIIAAKLTKFNPYIRLLIGMTLDMIMITNDFFATIPQMIIAGSVLSGFSFGLIVPSMREIISDITDEKLRTTAQGLGDAAFMSLSGVIGSVVSGILVDIFNTKAMFLMCMCIQIIPLVMVIFYVTKNLKKSKVN